MRRVLLQVDADDGDTEAKLDRITAKADELKEKHPELSVKIDTAAASAKLAVFRASLKDAGKPVVTAVEPEIDEVALTATRVDLKAIADEKIEPVVKPKVEPEGKAEIDRLQRQLAVMRLQKQDIKIGLDATDAEIKIAELRSQIDGLSKDSGIAGKQSGSSFAGGFSPAAAGIASAVALALAALPAIAAGAGALAGIALGGALLVGTSQVKGPLYAQFQGMLSTLLSVLRVAALPLLRPLADAFAQVGQWAKALYPELHAVFASLGPLVMPLTKGLEGLVSGILPGFIALMKSAQPAVQAVAGVLAGLSSGLGQLLAQMAPGVRASSVVLSAVGQILRALLPVVGSLANALAGALGPALRTFGGIIRTLAGPLQTAVGMLGQMAGPVLSAVFGAVARVLPPVAKFASVLIKDLAPVLVPLTKEISQVAGTVAGQLQRSLTQALPSLEKLAGTLADLLTKIIIPNLPAIGKMAVLWFQVQTSGVIPLLPPLAALTSSLLTLMDNVITPLLPLLNDLVNWLGNVASAVSSVLSSLSSLSSVPGLGFLAGLGGGGGSGVTYTSTDLGGGGGTGGGGGSAAYDAAAASAGAAYGSTWAAGTTAGMLATAQKTTRPAAANLALILSQGVLAGLSGTAGQVQGAISRLLGAVTTDVSGKYLTTAQGSAISKWLLGDEKRLVALADKRARILALIARADAYAASVTSSTETTFGVVPAAQSITPALGVGGILRQLLGDVAQIRVFKANIAKLRKMGLNRAYIDQIIQAGPVAGGEVAAELAAGNEGDIRAVNKAEAQIAAASVSLGRTAAEAMFDSGKMAGKGFLSGLQAQQKQLEAEMKKLADVLVQTLKKELKISSPSQVARDLFAQVPAGGVLGLRDGHAAMTAESTRLARAAVSGRASAGGGYAGGGGHFTFEVVGGGGDGELIELLVKLLKKRIRITGGDPAVLGA